MQSDEMYQKAQASTWASPLGIIALFLTVTETVSGLTVMQATGVIQIALTAYVIVLPILVLIVFTAVLWNKPFVLYPPDAFAGGATISDFQKAMLARYGKVLEQREFDEARIQEIIREALRSALARQAQAAGSSERGIIDATEIVSKTIAEIDEHLLTIDTAPLGGLGKVRKLPYDANLTVSQLLDDIYFSIAEKVGMSTYGRQWVLQDLRTKQFFSEMGRSWAAGRGLPNDDRRLGEVGLEPGMWLQTIRI